MGRLIVKDKVGKYAVWSSIVDDYIILHATREELIECYRREAADEAEVSLVSQLAQVESTGISSSYRGAVPDFPPEQSKEY